MKEKKASKLNLFIDLMKKTNPPKKLLIPALIMSLITTGAGFVVPMFTQSLVDGFSMDSLSISKVAFLGAAFIIQAITSGLAIYLLNKVGQHVIAGLRDMLWKKVLHLPVSYYDNNESGEILSRVTNDTAVVKALISEHLANCLTGVISIVGSIIMLFTIDWKMTTVMFIAIPFAAIILGFLGKKMYVVAKSVQDETANFTSILSQILPETRLVKSSNSEDIEYNRGKNKITQLYRLGLKESKINALITPIIYFILTFVMVTVIGLGGVRVSSGAITAGALVAFILYLIQILMPTIQLTMFFTELQKAIGATERINELLNSSEEDLTLGDNVIDIKQPINIENLDFSYNDETILSNLNFTIEPGKVTAIVGPSGSGKTTTFSLIERYYNPTKGSIKLGDRPIDEFALISWRSKIGYVAQESSLISGTIRDNICYGIKRNISDEELKKVAKMAYAYDFICELPNKFDTEVGERGVKLSGGQRQRISIARALLRDPEILMLDEATSSLDSKSEIYVQKALDNLMKNRTTIVIAHRLSTVVSADKIIFLDKGNITGEGTHYELFESHDTYREFATQQLKIKEKAC
jgi:ATP-binding cassette, subfamily B, bacterial AbcA/BmrA